MLWPAALPLVLLLLSPGPPLSCLDDLEWSSKDTTLLPTLQVLYAVAPFSAVQQQQPGLKAVQAANPQDQAWALSDAVQALEQLLQQFEPVVCSNKRLSAAAVQQLVKLFFHGDLFQHR